PSCNPTKTDAQLACVTLAAWVKAAFLPFLLAPRRSARSCGYALMRPAVHRVHRHCSITVASLSLATRIAVPEARCLWTPVGRRCLDQVLDATHPATAAPAVVAGFTLRSALVTSERSGLVTRAAGP